jgi:hypothetical protein
VTTILQGQQLRLVEYGFQVLKANQALPQTATSTLFTVTGGRVIITSLVGTVHTAIQNQACTLALGTVPTTGTASSTGIATATSIINLEAGTHVYLPQTKGALTVNANAGAAAQMFAGAAYVVSAGAVSWTTSASNTGAFDWALTYIPLDTGASVS